VKSDIQLSTKGLEEITGNTRKILTPRKQTLIVGKKILKISKEYKFLSSHGRP
jgi:hypothetical protein